MIHTPPPPDAAPLRVHASPVAAHGRGHNRAPGQPTFKRVCPVCGDEVRSGRRWGDFCSTAHRDAFNNRRKARGAEIYDLIMAWRFERGAAKHLRLWRVVCRLASEWRAEDRRERDGRKSWRSPRAVIDRRPYLTSATVKRRD